jgi:hypothetical protein
VANKEHLIEFFVALAHGLVVNNQPRHPLPFSLLYGFQGMLEEKDSGLGDHALVQPFPNHMLAVLGLASADDIGRHALAITRLGKFTRSGWFLALGTSTFFNAIYDREEFRLLRVLCLDTCLPGVSGALGEAVLTVKIHARRLALLVQAAELLCTGCGLPCWSRPPTGRFED